MSALLKASLATLALAATVPGLTHAATLDNVKQRGAVVCGATTGFAGFLRLMPKASGRAWTLICAKVLPPPFLAMPANSRSYR